MTDTRILYNAQCPVCRFEIHHYRDYAADQDLPLRFDDLNAADLAPWGLTQDEAARRLYVLHDGQMTSGIPAFLILWRQMPRYHWLARLIDLPVIRPTACFVYDRALAPTIYRWHLRRRRKMAG